MARDTLGYFARLRFFRRPDLTLGNFLDEVCRRHDPDSCPVRLTRPLAHARLAGQALSYRQLLDFAKRLGAALRDLAGMQRYDRVAIYKANAPDYFILSLAVIRAGGIAVPVNGRLPLDELRHYLQHTGVRLLITDRETYAAMMRSPAALPMVRMWLFPGAPLEFPAPHLDLNLALEQVSDSLPPARLHADSDVLIVHTSGTTGFPKAVLHASGTTLRALATLCLNLPGPSRNRRQVYAWPNSHLIAHHTGCLTLLANFPTFYVPDLDGEEVLELIAREQVTEYGGFPDSYIKLREAGLDRYRLDSMRCWFSAADAAHEAHVRCFTRQGAMLRSWHGRPLVRSLFVETLGSSEINGPAVVRFIFASSRSFGRYVGRPVLGGPRVKVADEEGRALPPGAVGRLMVKGPALFKGYWNAHERLHGVLQDGWWATGDVAYRDRWGRVYQLDRLTDVILTVSGPVYSLPLEEDLLEHPQVSEAVVFGIPQADGLQVPVAVVAPRAGQALSADDCLSWIRRRQGSTAPLQAVRVVPLAAIRRGLTGKVLKRALREQFAGELPGQASSPAVIESPAV